jgi:RNA polymerase sigma factor (sigma-70 family)
MTSRQTEKVLNPPATWRRQVIRVLSYLAKTIEMTAEEHRIAEQVAMFQYVDNASDVMAAAQHATRFVSHRRREPLSPAPSPATLALPLPHPPEPTSAISDEAILARMSDYIDDLAHSFRKSANLSIAEMEDWAQDLRVKCLSIPQDKRDQMTWCRVALKNYARDMYRKKVRRGKYMVNIEDDAEHVEASTAAESSAIAQTETTNDANKLLSLLNPLQQTIVREMLMSDSKPRPAEISKRLGITQDRLQAELAAAMEIMRSAAEDEHQ